MISLLKYPANGTAPEFQLQTWEQEEVEAFIDRRRYFQACSSSIYQMALSTFASSISRGSLSHFQETLLIYKLFQKRSIPHVVELMGVSGKKAFDDALRVAVVELYAGRTAC